MKIDTAHARMRPLTVADVDDLVLLDADPEVMRYVSGGIATPRAVIEEWVLPRAQAARSTHGTGVWALTDPSGRIFFGWLSLRSPRHSVRSDLELTYRLRRTVWGRGLATEAAGKLVAFAFTQLGAERVFASTMAVNLASRRVMEKIGMSLAGIHICDDRYDEGAGPASIPDFLADGGFDRTEVEYELSLAQWADRVNQAPTVRFLSA